MRLARSMTIAPLKPRMPTRMRLHCGRLIAAVAVVTAMQHPAHAEAPTSLAPVLPEDTATTLSHRNERSTPRASVLPASPAIAPRHEDSEDRISVGLAKAVLLRLGYPVGRLDDRITAKFKAALFRYQRAHGIPSSGTLDDATLRSLGFAAK